MPLNPPKFSMNYIIKGQNVTFRILKKASEYKNKYTQEKTN